MEETNVTKYERRRQEKIDREQIVKKQKSRRRIWRYVLWLGVLVLIVVTFWQINRLVSGDSKSTPGATSTSEALFVKSSDWIRGATSSPVVLIEYSDFECPACAEYSNLISQLEKDYPDKLAVVYRHYPWFFHSQAMNASLAAEAAGDQGQFWAMHDLLFSKQKEWADAKGIDIFIGYAEKLGLDAPSFRLTMEDKNLRKKIEDQLSEGKRLGIDQTPSFAINGKIIENPRSYEQFRQVIDQTFQNR